MSKSVVRKMSYKTLTQSELATFAANVHQRMASRPEYQSFTADIASLAEKTEAYTQALVDAASRSTASIAQKELAKNSVLSALDRIAFLLDFNFTGQDVWVINAGMEMIRDRRVNQNKLEAPYQLRAINKGVKGEISLQFRLPEPELARKKGFHGGARRYGVARSFYPRNIIHLIFCGTLPSKSDFFLCVTPYL